MTQFNRSRNPRGLLTFALEDNRDAVFFFTDLNPCIYYDGSLWTRWTSSSIANMKTFVFATIATGIWVNLSEFLRNEMLFKHHWHDKFQSLGIEFPSEPINGVLWLVWGFLFAGSLVAIRHRFTFLETTFLGWIMGFVLMWLVTGNLNVLPLRLLPMATVWSFAEVAVAVLIAQRIVKGKRLKGRSEAA